MRSTGKRGRPSAAESNRRCKDLQSLRNHSATSPAACGIWERDLLTEP